MFETKHRTSDVIRSLKVTKSAIVGFQKIHEKNIEKVCHKQQKKVPVWLGCFVKKIIIQIRVLISGIVILRILILGSEREGEVFGHRYPFNALTVKR
jgi:hypothetical protein